MEARERKEVPRLRAGKMRRRSGRDDGAEGGEKKERSLDCARDDIEESGEWKLEKEERSLHCASAKCADAPVGMTEKGAEKGKRGPSLRSG